jgi:hypothetical protein
VKELLRKHPMMRTSDIYAELKATDGDKVAIKQAVSRFKKNLDAVTEFSDKLEGDPLSEADE